MECVEPGGGGGLVSFEQKKNKQKSLTICLVFWVKKVTVFSLNLFHLWWNDEGFEEVIPYPSLFLPSE